MVKYYEAAVTFQEFPDEVSLCVSLTSCPNKCIGCSEPWLQEDIGIELTEAVAIALINKHPGITLFGILGGDQDHTYLLKLVKKLKEIYPGLRFGMYSGLNYLDLNLLTVLDYYKIGEWRMFQGDESTWKDQTAGPICLPTSNQIMFKREGNNLVNITDRFRDHMVHNWKSVII